MPHKYPTNGGKAEPRPFWSATITFGLVSVPVEIYPAVRPHRISLRQLGPNGMPLKRRYFRPDDDKPIPPDDIVRGFEREEGSFVVVTDDELKALAPKKSREIDLRVFVDREEIPLRQLERPYLLIPAGESTKAYHLLSATMEKSNKAGIATFVMRGKEYLAAIFAEGGLLRAATLHFVDELRTPADIGLPEISAAPAKLTKEAQTALKKLKTKKLNQDLFHDEHAKALLALAEKKRKGHRDVVEAPATEAETDEEMAEVIDIMSVLKQRMQADSASKSERPSDADDLAARSKKELLERAQELELQGRSGMTKEELIEAIRSAA